MEGVNFIEAFEFSVNNHLQLTALVDYYDVSNQTVRTYEDLAFAIFQYHRLWKSIGLRKGDKIAIIGSNSSEWVEIYMAIVTGGYVAVILPNTFREESVIDCLYLSDSKLLYSDLNSLSKLDFSSLYNLIFVCGIHSREIIFVHKPQENTYKELCHYSDNSEDYFETISFPIKYLERSNDDICTILYSSGTTGIPKGSMLSIQYMSVNIKKMRSRLAYISGDSEICIAPFHHLLGLGADLITSICSGMRLVFPKSISLDITLSAIKYYQPRNIFAPPMLLCNLLDQIFQVHFGIHFQIGALSQHDFFTNYRVARNELVDALGGRIESFTVGGASMPIELEDFVINTLQFPLVIAYGLTECGISSLGIVGRQKCRTVGTVFKESKVRIFSKAQNNRSGEIQIQDNIFSGYYNDIEATRAAFTDDGWFKTGDMGYIDEDGNLFITGRIKDMLLTSNGENIYPEEIEETMNAFPYVKESILVQRGEKLYAIVVPDREKAEADGLDAEGLNKKIDEAVREASKKLPGFTIISGFELRDEPLERTPKGSLKRYLYSDGIKEN